MSVVQTKYGAVSYDEAGAGAPVVLIHGVGLQAAAWGPQAKALAATHRVISLNMPGHGGSADLPAGSDLPVFVRWLNAVIEALDLQGVSLAGHSMGALIAGGFAVQYPERLARVALVNGVFRRDAKARAAVVARAETIGQGAFDLETPLNRWFGDGYPAERAQVEGWLSQVDVAGYSTAYRAFACGDAVYADRFADITIQLLALTGDRDLNSTPAMSHSMAQAAQNGRALVIPGHGHMVNLTAADAVTQALQDWLGEG